MLKQPKRKGSGVFSFSGLRHNPQMRKAVLYGREQYDAVPKNWAAVANVFSELAAAKADFVATLLS
jgi:hypothetical protein